MICFFQFQFACLVSEFENKTNVSLAFVLITCTICTTCTTLFIFKVLEMKGMSGRMKDSGDYNFASSWGDTAWDTAPQVWDATSADNWADSTTATIAEG
jgi:hypothetical protein